MPVILDVARMTGGGYSLRLRFDARLEGACMRCLEPAAPGLDVDAREIYQPGGEGSSTGPTSLPTPSSTFAPGPATPRCPSPPPQGAAPGAAPGLGPASGETSTAVPA